jgi:hypothetical protein
MASKKTLSSAYRHSATVTVANQSALRELLASRLDFGCTPSVKHNPDGSFAVTVIAPEEELQKLRKKGHHVLRHPLPKTRAQVGVGNRFAAGTVPHGFGKKEPRR